jgi:hypothetical protein
MSTLSVEKLNFDFKPSVVAAKYDDWKHHREVLQRNNKSAVDIVANDSTPPATTWLIEAKDFRIISKFPKPANLEELPETVAKKASDTWAGLIDAAKNADSITEKQHAADALATKRPRVVLHLEPPTRNNLGESLAAAHVLGKLRQLVIALDPNPLVLNIANTSYADVPWTVA